MKKVTILILFALFTISCEGQKTDLKLQWRDFESKEAGVKVSLPCEPTKNFNSIQDEPRPIYLYEFSCEIEGMTFLLSSKHHSQEFNEKTFSRTFEIEEELLKTIFGEVNTFNEKSDFLANGFVSKYYEVRPKKGGTVNKIVVLSKIRSYTALFGIMPKNERKIRESKIDFESISKKFIDSFQVIE